MPVDVVERPRDRKTPRPLVSNPLRRLPVQQVHSGPPVSLTRRLALTARARRAWSARVPGARARGARPSSALTCTRRSHRSRAPSSRRPPARAPTCPREGPTPNFGGGAARHCFIFFGDTEWTGRGVAPPLPRSSRRRRMDRTGCCTSPTKVEPPASGVAKKMKQVARSPTTFPRDAPACRRVPGEGPTLVVGLRTPISSFLATPNDPDRVLHLPYRTRAPERGRHGVAPNLPRSGRRRRVSPKR